MSAGIVIVRTFGLHRALIDIDIDIFGFLRQSQGLRFQQKGKININTENSVTCKVYYQFTTNRRGVNQET